MPKFSKIYVIIVASGRFVNIYIESRDSEDSQVPKSSEIF